MTLSLPRLIQPKAQIADLVSQAGFKVPERFASFDEAVQSGIPFIARSEHPREFAGESGIADSVKIDQPRLELAKSFKYPDGKMSKFGYDRKNADTLQALKHRLGGGTDRDFEIQTVQATRSRQIERHAKLLGISIADYLKDFSFTYWQLLAGWNQTIIADNTVPNRYHVFTKNTAGVDAGIGYATLDANHPTRICTWHTDEAQFIESALALVSLYEEIRRLPYFDPNHCPIIEAQFVNGIHYFLQYHCVRDNEPSAFELTREKQDNEIEPFFVRGATPAAGTTVQAAFYYPEESDGSHSFENMESGEDASFDYHYNHVFSEFMFRKRQVQFIDNTQNTEELTFRAATNHLEKSGLFKPRISIASRELNSLISEDETSRMFKETERTGKPARLPFHVISDGRRAFVRRAD